MYLRIRGGKGGRLHLIEVIVKTLWLIGREGQVKKLGIIWDKKYIC